MQGALHHLDVEPIIRIIAKYLPYLLLDSLAAIALLASPIVQVHHPRQILAGDCKRGLSGLVAGRPLLISDYPIHQYGDDPIDCDGNNDSPSRVEIALRKPGKI